MFLSPLAMSFFMKSFIIHVDMSYVGLGTVLIQEIYTSWSTQSATFQECFLEFRGTTAPVRRRCWNWWYQHCNSLSSATQFLYIFLQTTTLLRTRTGINTYWDSLILWEYTVNIHNIAGKSYVATVALSRGLWLQMFVRYFY